MKYAIAKLKGDKPVEWFKPQDSRERVLTFCQIENEIHRKANTGECFKLIKITSSN